MTAVCLSMPKIFEEMMIMGHGTDLFGDVLEFGGNFDLSSSEDHQTIKGQEALIIQQSTV